VRCQPHRGQACFTELNMSGFAGARLAQ
jgi:hypothetical protein